MILIVFLLVSCAIAAFAIWWFLSNLDEHCAPKTIGLLTLVAVSQFICGVVSTSEKWKSNLVRLGHAEWYLDENFDRRWRLIPHAQETKKEEETNNNSGRDTDPD
jgi:hypothetical protein